MIGKVVYYNRNIRIGHGTAYTHSYMILPTDANTPTCIGGGMSTTQRSALTHTPPCIDKGKGGACREEEKCTSKSKVIS